LNDQDHRDLEKAGWTVVPADAASLALRLLQN
jgi:hypothetical protein